MSNRLLLRIAALAAVSGAVAEVVSAVLEPDWGGEPAAAVRVVADSGLWDGRLLLDLIGVFLTVGALTVVGRTLSHGSGRDWAAVGQPFLVLMGALGAGAILSGADMKELADTWLGAAPAAKQSYLASFDASSTATEDLFFGAFLAMGVYLGALAPAILTGGVYARWLGWAAGVSCVLVLAGDLLVIAFDAAFVAVLAGFVLFKVVVVALGFSMWRQAEGRRPAFGGKAPFDVSPT
jgi:hypothetical protein